MLLHIIEYDFYVTVYDCFYIQVSSGVRRIFARGGDPVISFLRQAWKSRRAERGAGGRIQHFFFLPQNLWLNFPGSEYSEYRGIHRNDHQPIWEAPPPGPPSSSDQQGGGLPFKYQRFSAPRGLTPSSVASFLVLGVPDNKKKSCTYVTYMRERAPQKHTLRKLPVKVSLVIYFPCKIVLIYQECGDSACRSHNEITRQRGQINYWVGPADPELW